MASTTEDASLLIAGDTNDRIFGLDAAFQYCEGRAVLDTGCHDGRVAEFFAKAGASRIDGCDIFLHGIELASKRISGIQPNSNFATLDLSQGKAVLGNIPLLKEYDIVCYLGVHQHLKRQMLQNNLAKLEADIFLP